MWERAAAPPEHCCVSSSVCASQSRAAATVLHQLLGSCLWSGAARCEDVRMWGCEDVRMWGCFPAWAVPLLGQPEPEPWCCSDPNAVPGLARAVKQLSPMLLCSGGMGLFGKGKGDLIPIFQVAESVPVFPSFPANRSKRLMSTPPLPSHPFSEANKCQQILH